MKPERALAALAYLARFLTFPFARYDVRGGSHLNDTVGAAVIAANHRSLFDIVAGLIAFQRYGRYPLVLIEKRYVDAKWTRPFARAIGAIPVDRAAGRGEAFRAAADALGDGLTILILPEGKLHWDPAHPLSTGPTSTGVSRLAEASGVPVCCAAIVGTEAIWPATKWLPRFRPFRRRTVTIRISDRLVEFDGDDHRERTEQVMVGIRELMATATADAVAARAGR